MSRHYSRATMTIGLTTLLVGAPAGGAGAQQLSQEELGKALQNLFKGGASEGGRPEAVPAPRPRPGVPAGEASAHGPDFVLLGVVISSDTRMALLEGTAVNPGGRRFLRLGESVGNRRLTDVQPDRVTLEGQGGERLIVRLGSGGGVGTSAPGPERGVVPSTSRPAVPPASSPVVDGSATPATRADRTKAGEAAPDPAQLERDAKKQEKNARKAEKKVQDRARAAARRAATGN